jgi:hypothetical protein
VLGNPSKGMSVRTKDASDRASRLHRALDCIMDRRARAKDAAGKLLGAGNGFEYWQVGDDVFRNQVGNRGPMEGGKPSNARWECSIAHYNRFKESVLGVAADKASGLTAEDAGLLSSLLEHATGAVKAGLGAMSPSEDSFEESEHPRAGGRFASASSGGSAESEAGPRAAFQAYLKSHQKSELHKYESKGDSGPGSAQRWNIKKTYIVKALNLNDVLVSQKIEAYSERQAAEIVVRKNKYLRVQSVEVAPAAKQWPF